MKQLDWLDMQDMFLKQVYCIQMLPSLNQSQNSNKLCTWTFIMLLSLHFTYVMLKGVKIG